MRTVYNLTQVDAGFDRSRLVTFRIAVLSNATGRSGLPTSGVQSYQRVLDTLRAIPGVEAASAMSGLPPNRPV